MSATLLLNATYEPLRVISWQRAVILVLTEQADVLEEGDRPVRSAYIEMNAPSVIRLRYMVKVPYRARLPLSRQNLVVRDKGLCQYCGKRGDTIDHVHPRSKGGEHAWENVVLACRPCNGKKADRTLEQLGWKLTVKPFAPKGQVVVGFGRLEATPTWQQYLPAAI